MAPASEALATPAVLVAQDAAAWDDLPGWRALLQRHESLFAPWVEGGAIGLVERAVADAGAGRMLVWVRMGGATQVQWRDYRGFADCGVAVLFVAQPGALAAVHARLHDNALGQMKLQLRQGGMLLYVLVAKAQLLDEGFEDFLESLGLAFMGACR
ncbi:MAG: hypothetical protein LC125_11580 [Burkholderiales bacterium]|nr:hypothetical protein [Burkholderiales bacterium]